MSLLRNLSLWFRQKHDEAVEATKDPVRDAKFDIRDSETAIRGFESKIQNLMRANNNIKKQRDNAREEVKKWKNLAKKAAQAQDEADVAACIQKKQVAEKEVAQYTKDIKTNDEIVANLRQQLGKARNKVARAKSNTAVLSARMTSAKLRTSLAAGAKGLGDGPLSRLDDLENAVQDAESDAEAWEELHTDDTENLEDKYSSGDADVDDEVAAMMAEYA